MTSQLSATSFPASTFDDPRPNKGDAGQPDEFERLWRGFMTARATLGLVLMALQGGIYVLAAQQNMVPLLICTAYFAEALAVRLMTRPQQLGQTFDVQWLRTLGVDVLAFATLQVLQGNTVNYTALFALPVLMVSVIGTMMQAIAAAAAVTLLLFAYAIWLATLPSGDINTYFMQAALTGAGCFAISFIASQVATRLATVERRAQRNQLAATVQRQVNELVIASLADGVLVVDAQGDVRSANPAAHKLLGNRRQAPDANLRLGASPQWHGLMKVIHTSFETQLAQQSDIQVQFAGQGVRRLRVRTQLTAALNDDATDLCVVFMQDQIEIQARIRSEKLASMGRMSAAVAHEIRNPLAAISQANALLAEDLHDPALQRLASMVQQNATRLESIVQDVLHLTHTSTGQSNQDAHPLDLLPAVQRVCRDWSNQNQATHRLHLALPAGAVAVRFDAEHLRRILVNLLDNASRYASQQPQSIQVSVTLPASAPRDGDVCLQVWSDGAPLDPSVEQHLFEPFFSSESRSSGLGLYICRELCEGQAASISYGRSDRRVNERPISGNEFSVTFKILSDPGQPKTP